MPRGRQFRVLLATDGSTVAKAATSTAIGFPWPPRSGMFVVVAKQVRVESRRSILLAALDQTAEFVARSAARSLARRWPDVQVHVVDASPVDAIIREATRIRVNVIVMGWRGQGAIRRFLTGSVSRGVVRRAPCAVLVVRRAVRRVQHVVIGVDGSSHARRAIALITRLQPPRGGRVLLLSAIDTMWVPAQALAPLGTRATVGAEVGRINRGHLARARREIERASKLLAAAGWKVDAKVATGAPLRELIGAVGKKRVDLLVVGARGVTGIRHLLLGSVAEGALNRSPVPVLIVR